jgi:hypothetical protein
MNVNPTLAQLRAVRERYPVDPAQVRAMLMRIPPSWTKIEDSLDGACFVRGTVQVIVSLGLYDDGQLWIHASLCGRTGQNKFCLPSWEELKRVKHDFIGDERWAYQVLPPPTDYINQNPSVLHLFARFEGANALPDFTRGLGTL